MIFGPLQVSMAEKSPEAKSTEAERHERHLIVWTGEGDHSRSASRQAVGAVLAGQRQQKQTHWKYSKPKEAKTSKAILRH
jgi:hypothetical protein